MKRSTAFFINGGAGRVITSIPGFEKFREENPDDDFIIVCEGGTEFYKGHPDLDKRAYDIWHKNLFQDKIKQRNCVSPEPYRVWHYYNQEASLAQSFDIIFNNLEKPRSLPRPTLRLSRDEMLNGVITMNEVKQMTGKDKVAVIQPFGRGIEFRDGIFNDSTSRSIEYSNLVSLVQKLQKKGFATMIMAEMQIDFSGEKFDVPIPQPQGISLRQWSGLIKDADIFIGCDSVGQHIAYAVETPTVSVISSTYPVNISYPEEKTFKIIDLGERDRQYAPIRIAPDEHTDRMNDGLSAMSEKQEDDVIKAVQDLVKKFPKPETAKPKMAKLKGGEPQQQVCPVHGVAHEHGHMHHPQQMPMPNMVPQTPAAMAPSTPSQFGIGPSGGAKNLPPFMNPKQEVK
jgi:hypothetical protein